MDTVLRILAGRRFWLFFVLPQLVFAALAAATHAIVLLPALSVVITALAIGICVAFMPSVLGFFAGEGPVDRADALALGIWCTWFATALTGAWSFMWRYQGQPLWLVNNDVVGYFRYLIICGAVLHLAAPGAITNRIPPARWIKIGILVAAMVGGFAGFIFVEGLFRSEP